MTYLEIFPPTYLSLYYQHNAIKHVLEAIAQGKNRILLTMVTEMGKIAKPKL
ncbi:hypothetical protein VB735_27010 [Halotia wernerae UHCC 0503]|nr:hypothetical protein [Halotia wernerae UHCC 0503]